MDEVKGVKIAKQANFNQPRTIFGPILNPFGAEYYWQEDPLINDDYDKDSDIHLLRNNYITITPCYINFTHGESMDILREIKW
ncbi:MAG: 5'(3')-nucleotidase/polyphosphatase [Alphaproteobacteria bacterium ADurb.Bin438]|nr:MAG: 5'(3')-nucleotidase/polyphosphatase [Alphaproteobacteria bacterium ADurb.Bin438]